MRSGVYIYGIIGTDSPQEFGSTGIGEQASRVFTVGFRDIAAVVSTGPLTLYDSLTKEKTIKDLVTHQFVLEKVMAGLTVLPVKFGTQVETEQDVVQFLEQGYALLSEQLRKMEGNIELDVVAQWELPRIMAAVYRDNPHIQSKQLQLARQGDRVAVEERVSLGQLVAQALAARKASSIELIVQALKEQAIDLCLHGVANDEMILNAAFLLEKQREGSFHDAVALQDRGLDDAENFRVVGPLPAYSFSTILLEKIDSRSFEEAREILGLQGEITAKTVREAYRQLAQKSHPDTAGAEHVQDFSKLHAAYRTLMQVAEHGMTRVEVYRLEQDLP